MTYRNRALLDLCHEAPCLLLPGQHQCIGPPSEPAHSDMIRHGRGEKHKSHDCFAVPGCHNAHLAFTRANLGKDGYHAAWTEAMERYVLYLWVSGKIQITAAPRAGKEPSMEAPHCRICDHKHWAREPHILPADAPTEKRSKRPAIALPAPAKASITNTNADRGKAPKGGKRTPGRSGDSLSFRIAARVGGTPATNTSREGRRVLKAEAARPDATRTAATAKPNPPPATPGKPAGKQTNAEKVTPGKRQTASKANKRKGKKK